MKAAAEKESGKQKRLGWILFLLMLFCLAVDRCISFADLPSRLLETQLPLEPNAQPMEEEPQTGQVPAQGGRVDLNYSSRMAISLSTGEVELVLDNPSASNQSLQIQLSIQGTTVVSSGLLPPGYQVRTLDGADTSRLRQGSYDGVLHLVCFQQDTGQESILNIDIPVTVSVTR